MARGTAVVAAAIAAALTTVSPANAAQVDYVALGDSYASGTGTGSYDLSSTCQRSSSAATALWAAGNTSSFTFAACGGATTSSVERDQLGGLSPNTDVVTITVGGNDAGFISVVLSCRLGTDDLCFGAVDKAVSYAETELSAKLEGTYKKIKAKAPNAKLVVVGYPRLYETTNCGFGAVSVERREHINRGADVIARVTAAAAAAQGARYVDVRDRFAGHAVCASQPWLNGPSLPLSDSYHPSKTGYRDGYLPALRAVL
ncbi:SGNH/GDSL hydrolase family protein [Amycolatopsis sp. NPDC004378]